MHGIFYNTLCKIINTLITLLHFHLMQKMLFSSFKAICLTTLLMLLGFEEFYSLLFNFAKCSIDSKMSVFQTSYENYSQMEMYYHITCQFSSIQSIEQSLAFHTWSRQVTCEADRIPCGSMTS